MDVPFSFFLSKSFVEKMTQENWKGNHRWCESGTRNHVFWSIRAGRLQTCPCCGCKEHPGPETAYRREGLGFLLRGASSTCTHHSWSGEPGASPTPTYAHKPPQDLTSGNIYWGHSLNTAKKRPAEVMDHLCKANHGAKGCSSEQSPGLMVRCSAMMLLCFFLIISQKTATGVSQRRAAWEGVHSEPARPPQQVCERDRNRLGKLGTSSSSWSTNRERVLIIAFFLLVMPQVGKFLNMIESSLSLHVFTVPLSSRWIQSGISELRVSAHEAETEMCVNPQGNLCFTGKNERQRKKKVREKGIKTGKKFMKRKDYKKEERSKRKNGKEKIKGKRRERRKIRRRKKEGKEK